uniref:Sodium/potassium/calcium exchanger 5 n=4 Tax=Lygus hesperus TaxID=30085 RepID=A0A0A9WUZ3_LYGHE
MAKWFVIAFFATVLLSERIEGKKHNTTNNTAHLTEESRHEEGCAASSVEHFPPLPLPGGPVLSTAITLVAVGYLFVFLVRVCDKHFVSCIKTIGKASKLSSDVAGATLMAAAVSCPDLFINLIGTFVTQGDIGIGTIVGCGIFNTLAVPALCILISPTKSIRLKGWSLSRDCTFYCAALVTLSVALIDNIIEWYEALSLVVIYVFYLLVLCINSWLRNKTETAINFCIKVDGKYERTPLLLKSHSILSYGVDEDEDSLSDFEARSFPRRVWYFVTIPIDMVLELTIPKSTSSCHGFKLYPLTFIICLIWIAVVSYVIAWFITITGFELRIPDSLVGLTFIAIGMSVPQAASSVIIAKQGDGAMALSNAIGSNVFDNLLCLGLPWLLKCLVYQDNFVEISSRSISYSFVILISSTLFLYAAAALNKFRLNWTVGIFLLCLYFAFAVLSVLLELNIFFVANLPFCM